MFRADLMPRSHDAALEQTKCGFHGVCMQIANDVDAIAVIDRLMLSEHSGFCNRLRIGGEIVRHYHVNVFAYILSDLLRQSARANIISMKEPQITIALPDADDDLFWCAASALAATFWLAAYVGFINLNRACHFLRIRLGHGSADSVAEIPCGFVA